MMNPSDYICDRAIPTGKMLDGGPIYRCMRYEGTLHFAGNNPPCWRCRFNAKDVLIDPAVEFMGNAERAGPGCASCRPE